MPRIARKKSESGYYHIVLRGINKQNLFYDDEDKVVLLNRFKLIKKQNDFDLVAFCIMCNHVHLLVKEKTTSISNIIRKALSSYVFWYNRKYERIGNLFQDRFKSEPIEDDMYLLCCARYIFQNPLKAMLCDNVWEYQWSSANLLINGKESFVNDIILRDVLKEQLIKFMEENESNEYLEWESKIAYTDEKMQAKIKETLKDINIYNIMQLDKEQRNEILSKIMKINGISIRQAARITGVPISIIRYI